jgi:hypothetical protein
MTVFGVTAFETKVNDPVLIAKASEAHDDVVTSSGDTLTVDNAIRIDDAIITILQT